MCSSCVRSILEASEGEHIRLSIGIHGGFRRWIGDERGITGLETAIILIAFVVVASVFAYTVMTAGIYSSQKANEAVNSAIEEVRSSISPSGKVLAYTRSVDTDGLATSTDDRVSAIVQVSLEVRTAINGVPIDVTPPYQINSADGSLESSGLTNTLVVDYLAAETYIENIAWTVDFSGANDDDFSLEAAERAIITVWLVEYDYDSVSGLYYSLGGGESDPFIDSTVELLGPHSPFSLEVSPVRGAPFQVERVTPQSLNAIMNLR